MTSTAARSGWRRARPLRCGACAPLRQPTRSRSIWCRRFAPSSTSSASSNANARAGNRSTRSCASAPHRATASTTPAAPWTWARRDLHRWKRNSSGHRHTPGCSSTRRASVSGCHTRAAMRTGLRMSPGTGAGIRNIRHEPSMVRGAGPHILVRALAGARCASTHLASIPGSPLALVLARTLSWPKPSLVRGASPSSQRQYKPGHDLPSPPLLSLLSGKERGSHTDGSHG